ncbi:FAD-dependent monooxygenase [Hellea balneolensis]|uniref:FAD-dependent monooxygenase n=1 Tax=Hellea balneolensis TaxID=287478 RepID=UPI0003FE9179|nr:FAD-dependent monooxygenase [Hellea balneolensis]
MRVIIAGAGIGGLTAALCCLHFGHEVIIFEQASELSEVGAGIQLPPNAMKVFKALSIDALISQTAFRPEALEARMGESGRRIFNVPLDEKSLERWGASYLHIHRADYVTALKTALIARSPKSLKLGVGIEDYKLSKKGVTIQLSDGRKVTADVLIAADGIKSKIRAKMLRPDTPRFTGNIAWRAVVPLEALGENAPASTACVWMGRKRHAVTYRIRSGELVNFVGVVETDKWSDESWLQKGNKEEALSDFSGWDPIIKSILKCASPDSFYRWALFDRDPLSCWVDGSAALLGDAAHPMLPFMAQGAAMAVEDGWVIARELSKNGRSVQASLKAYENLRLPRTQKAQQASRSNMNTFHQATVLRQIATYSPMWLAGHILPNLIKKRLDWLYSFDVTKSPL